ncbi:antirestriction protein ArdC [Bradyrhizobium japonicum]
MSNNLYANVTARILSELENGSAPWVKPWSATPGRNIPHNAATGRPYSGCNVVLLWMCQGRFSSPRFMTFVQAKKLGGNVRKGEHGFTVYFVKPMAAKEAKEGEKQGRGFMMLKAYTVFNVEQCENLPDRIVTPDPVKPRNSDERDATIEEFIAATGADYREGFGGDRAFYNPPGDFVAMPAFEAFNSAASYYSTAFHELGHWTGAKARLNREFGKRFGDKAYAAEELVAELTAAFLCAEFNVDGELRHAGYIANWIELLKEDARAFFAAASAAQKAADHMRQAVLAADEIADEVRLAA